MVKASTRSKSNKAYRSKNVLSKVSRIQRNYERFVFNVKNKYWTKKLNRIYKFIVSPGKERKLDLNVYKDTTCPVKTSHNMKFLELIKSKEQQPHVLYLDGANCRTSKLIADNNAIKVSPNLSFKICKDLEALGVKAPNMSFENYTFNAETRFDVIWFDGQVTLGSIAKDLYGAAQITKENGDLIVTYNRKWNRGGFQKNYRIDKKFYESHAPSLLLRIVHDLHDDFVVVWHELYIRTGCKTPMGIIHFHRNSDK